MHTKTSEFFENNPTFNLQQLTNLRSSLYGLGEQEADEDIADLELFTLFILSRLGVVNAAQTTFVTDDELWTYLRQVDGNTDEYSNVYITDIKVWFLD